MRIIIVRHADPDYSIDSLTETGWKEARACAKRIQEIDRDCGGIRSIYVSSYGRAQDTARCSLDLIGREDAITCEWLREFWPSIHRPDVMEGRAIAWDWLPQDWTCEPRYYDPKAWKETEVMREGHVGEEYDLVCRNLDQIIREHGYDRCDEEEGIFYHVREANNDTIVIFCHFGMECVLVSHLVHCSPMLLWHNFCALPSSLTTLVTEERREGIASFRVTEFGDTSHLYREGMKPSFSARFCECYQNEDERHD